MARLPFPYYMEDISMTIRLVVSANGIKINTVRSAFEKSLRARLIKTNPNSDIDCVRKFGSLFAEDIPIRALEEMKLEQFKARICAVSNLFNLSYPLCSCILHWNLGD
ncbi:hypothetical protein AG4045_005100 [Apium graveolens]|uniref:Uncharacterized protein n=1 Tax=Apium graveolens TaxID=4045 RepID=A0A6L5BAA5_APIGR|nr:hypothetical protein AG4045_005100 [Apium graveolens]